MSVARGIKARRPLSANAMGEAKALDNFQGELESARLKLDMLKLVDETYIKNCLYSEEGYDFGNFCLKVTKMHFPISGIEFGFSIAQADQKIKIVLPSEKMAKVISSLIQAHYTSDNTELMELFRSFGCNPGTGGEIARALEIGRIPDKSDPCYRRDEYEEEQNEPENKPRFSI